MRRATVLLLAAALAACSRASNQGPLVAEGDGIAISASELRKKLEEQPPFIRARYASLDRKKEFLENLIRFELLEQEARAKGLDKDPEVQEALAKLLVQKLVRQAFDAEKKPSDADVRAYYDAHLDEFAKPERVRVSLVLFDAPAGSPQRRAKAAEAQRALARLQAEGRKDPLAFSSLARELSQDPASKAAGGDLGHRTRDELAAQFGADLANAAFTLKEVGQESGVVETPRGFALLKLAARQPALDRPFDEVKDQLAARVGREARTKDFDAYVKALREKASVKIRDAELERIVVTGPPPSGVTAPAAGAAGESAPARP